MKNSLVIIWQTMINDETVAAQFLPMQKLCPCGHSPFSLLFPLNYSSFA